jgi:CelD/BcsL family acetyltransferase involved in cellulose biosynthesis
VRGQADERCCHEDHSHDPHPLRPAPRSHTGHPSAANLHAVPVDTHLLVEVDDRAAYVPEWRALAEASGNLFVTPDWYFSWLDVFADQLEPLLVLGEEDGRIVGVLPLVREKRWPHATRFAGDASADCVAPLCIDNRPDIRRALLAAAVDASPAILVLTHLEESTSNADLPNSVAQVTGSSPNLPYARIDDGWDAYLSRRSRNFRADLKRKERSLRDGYAVEYSRTTAAHDLDRDLGVFFRLHDERWNRRGGSTSSTDRIRAFFQIVARRCLDHGWLRLWQMSADEAPAAAFFGWSIGPTYSYYLAGFDAALARHSPGTLLLAHTIKDAVADGCGRYDLLLGDEQYKARFADDVRPVRSVVLGRPAKLPFALARLEAQARTTLNRLPDRPRIALQRAAARFGSRLPLTRTR